MRRGEAASFDLLLLYPTLLKEPSEIPAEVMREVGHSQVGRRKKSRQPQVVVRRHALPNFSHRDRGELNRFVWRAHHKKIELP